MLVSILPYDLVFQVYRKYLIRIWNCINTIYFGLVEIPGVLLGRGQVCDTMAILGMLDDQSGNCGPRGTLRGGGISTYPLAESTNKTHVGAQSKYFGCL